MIQAEDIHSLELLAGKLEKDFECIEYGIQKGSEINSKYLDHVDLNYDSEAVDPDRTYYSIAFFNSGHPDSDVFDIKGH